MQLSFSFFEFIAKLEGETGTYTVDPITSGVRAPAASVRIFT
jgi:hypothetical protein